MRPLTVLQVGAFPFPLHQGSQVYVSGLSRSLAARGHRVMLACYAGGSGPEPAGVELVRARAVAGASHRSGPHWSRVPQDLYLARVVSQILRENQVDVIHAHNVQAPVSAAVGRFGRRVPLIYNQHTSMRAELPSYFESRWARRAARGAGRVMDRVVPAMCDASIALSEEGHGQLSRLGGRVELVRPAVRIAELEGGDAARARHRWQLGSRPWVVYAGNADGYQDLPVLFDAMAHIPEAGLLFVTGADLAPWRARAAIPRQRLRMVQTTSFADVKDALSAAAVAVSPRTRCAGFPIKLLNQLGLGVPTVAARGSARPIPGVVPVPDHDPGAMAAAIGDLLANPARRAALSRAAAEAIRSDWTWGARGAELEAFYGRLLAL